MREVTLFFDSWHGLARVVIVGVLGYTALVLLLRVSGKRTLSKLNAFDLIVTVALGSTLATVLLSKDVALAEGVVAFGLLIALQFGITWMSVRSRKFSELVKAEPTLLLFQGQVLDGALRRERVTRDELLAAVRASGQTGIRQVHAVVLETDGTLNVVVRAEASGDAAMAAMEPLGKPADRGPAASSFLFCNRQGSSYADEQTGSAHGWDSMWQRFMDRVLGETKVEARFTEHDLRAKCASDAQSPEHARALLAHADARTTDAIYRRKPERVRPLGAASNSTGSVE